MAEPDPQQIPTEPAPPRPPATRIFFGDDGLRPGWALLLFAAIFFVLYAAFGSVAAAFIHPSNRDPALFSPASILRGESAALAAVLLATFAMSRIEGRPFTAFGLSPFRLPQRIAIGAAFGLGLVALLVACLRSFGYLVFEYRILHRAPIVTYALQWSFVFLIVALYEENLFRGYAQATLTRGLASLFRMTGLSRPIPLAFWTSAALLSFGFGFVHTQNIGESPIGVFAAGIVGLVFSLSLWRSGSLWWAIGCHAAWDWAESFLFGVYDSGTLARGRLFQTHPQGPLLLSGGLTGPEGSLFVLPTLLVLALAILITLPPREAEPPEPAVPAI